MYRSLHAHVPKMFLLHPIGRFTAMVLRPDAEPL